MAAAAAVLVVILAVPVAGRDNLIGLIGKWTAEQFSFFSTDSRENADRIPLAESFEEEDAFGEDLREVLLEYGITEEVVPHWAPEGFILSGNIIIQEYPAADGIDFIALYKCRTDSISINITKRSDVSHNLIYEKLPSNPEIHTIGDVQHYLFQNNFTSTAAWRIDDLECAINTTLSEDELILIIDSIYKYEETE